MKKYEKYKDSGIEWIGEIPEHWEVKKLNYCFSLIGSGTTPTAGKTEYYTNGEFNWLQTGDLNNSEINETSKKITQEALDDYSTLRFYPVLSIVIAMYGATIGKTGLLKIESTTNQACCVLSKPINLDSKFAFYWLNSVKNHIISLSYGGGQPNINQEQIRSLRIQNPTPEEQTAIANYLDRKTTEIDELIADKKRLLELYEEEKTAIINQAVTKGINPNVPMKDSGIEWLGEIPEHWEVKNLRYLCKITTGGKDTENREDDGEFPFFVRSQTVEKISTYSYDGEAILTAGDGVGVCKVWHHIIGKFDFHQRVYMMYDFDGISGSYLFHYMKENFIHDVLKKSAKSTVDSLRRPMFLEFAVAFPKSEDEQKEIVQYIENEIARIDSKSETTKKLIDLLTEYRTALISEVVTGKIKVTE